MLKKILKVVGALLAVFVAVGVFLPSTYTVQRSTQIAVVPGFVFPLLNNLERAGTWDPWGEEDATLKSTYSGPAEGVGAKGTWTSEKSGTGSQTITASKPNESVVIELDFGDQGKGTATYALTEKDGGTHIVWSMTGDVGFSLIGRYFALGMDSMIGPPFEKGLAKLKHIAETEGSAAGATPAGVAEPVPERVIEQPLRVGGLQTPESVLHDAVADVYLVSNINGSPFAKDDNGFITKIAPDGSILEQTWIDGASAEVTLNAPKGLAIVGDILYVSDIDTVRMFDRVTGASKGEIKLQGATFLNDISASADGTVYVSDSGFKEGFKPSGTDAIYKLVDGKAVVLIKDKTLGGPNGLLASVTGVMVVTFGSGELYTVALDGTRGESQKLPSGSLDGIVPLADGRIAISSWEANAVLVGKQGQAFEVAVAETPSPADIGYDAKRNRLLIPFFQEGVVLIQPL